MTDNDHSESAVIVYPAAWIDSPPEAHCTILYLGDIDDASYTREDLQEVLDSLHLVAPGDVKIVGTEMFGEEADHPVWVLEPTSLLKLTRKMIEDNIKHIGAVNASEFKDYRPHVTVSEEDYKLPEYSVVLGPPVIWWGDEK